MNAKQARELTNKAISEMDITPFLSKIYEEVKEAAEKGRANCDVMFNDRVILTKPMADLILEILAKDEFCRPDYFQSSALGICSITFTISW